MIPELDGDPVAAARALLGVLLVSRVPGVATAVRISEVEAYGAADDPASHAHRGRTPRNATMFGPPGRLYVYRSYGIHWCANVVCGSEGAAGAVLVRGGIPVAGLATMAERRGRPDHLCDGPGKLCQALGITGAHDGTDLASGPIRLEGPAARGVVTATRRIGVSRAQDRLWRFVWKPEDRS
ncbi:MAG: DNA-3-methyladenine glycosylase [Acidimicrobiia bacterium]|nr:DNA-3-methyladenine glycosylase [Acidimicrobiia bacterium]